MKQTFFNGMKGLALTLCALFISFNVMAQSAKVVGTVTDSNGAPITGATVSYDPTHGTATDTDGKYSINVPTTAELTFSYIGMESVTVSVNGRTIIDVTMQSGAVFMEEVVAIGYGVQKKADLTGSVTQVNGDILAAAPTPSLSQNLAGKLTGVQTSQYSGSPGFEDTQLIIRGASTTNSSSPLVLVDGVSRDWSRLDPNDIASMTVLKDAASTAVYGARAANGVILITTKRGAQGKPTINYTGSIGTQNPTMLPKVLNAYDYATNFNLSKLNAADGNPDGLFLYSDEAIARYKSGEHPSTNWVEETFGNQSMIQNHNVSINGGSDAVRYFVSAGMMDQDGLYAQSWYKRQNARSNIDADINKWINLSVDLSARTDNANRTSDTEDELWSKAVCANPTSPLLPEELQGDDVYPHSGLPKSPLGMANGTGYQNRKNTYIETSFKMNVEIPWVEGLSAMGRYSIDKHSRHDKTFMKKYTQYQYYPDTDEWAEVPLNLVEGLTESKTDYTNTMLQASLSYVKSFNKHNIDALLLVERETGNNNRLEASRMGFLSTDIDYMFGGNLDQVGNDGTAGESAREGYVGRISYNYANTYYLQVNGRYDGSYKFARGSKFGFFPSVSGSWRISEEPFMADVEWMDQLKLRASYGELGNDNLTAFQYLNDYGISSNKGFVVNGTYMPAIEDGIAPNADVTWETTATSNVGVDMTIMNGMWSIEADYFKKHTTDMLITSTASVPSSAGLQLPKMNLGEAQSSGFEAVVRHNNKIGAVDLSVDANVTYAVSELLYIGEPETLPEARKREGKPIGQAFGYESDGLFQTQEEIDGWALDQDKQKNASLRPGDIKYVDQNQDGVLDVEDQVAIGNPTIPELIFGLNLTASYKGFSLAASFQGASMVSRKVILDGPFALDSNTAYEVINDSWSPENTDAAYPRLVYGGANNNKLTSDFWLRDATYVRLKNLELSYTFNKSLLSQIGVENLRVFVSGTNLLTFSGLKFQDPETYNSANHFGFAPPMQTFTGGVSLSF